MKTNLRFDCFNRTLRAGVSALAFAGMVVAAEAQTSVRASVTYLGTQSNGASPQASISADGRYVVFVSSATNLVSPGTSGQQIFKRDLAAGGTTTLVSVDEFGLPASADCANPRISADGRYVVFSTDASLVGDDMNAKRDVYRRDTSLSVGGVTRVSLGDDESEGDGASDSGWMSGDCNLVVFRSDATNLVAGGTSLSQVFVRNLAAGTTELVSRENGPAGAQGNDYSGVQPTISADGLFVGFSTRASNLLSGDTNGVFDVYVRDLTLDTNRRISLAINGNQGFQDSYNSSMNDNGRYVAFVSNQGFVSGDTNGLHDVFLRDVVANTIIRVSVDSSGKQATGGASGATGAGAGWGARVSGDGSKVVFQSLATNLIKGDTNGAEDIFIRNRLTNTTTMVSLNTAGKPANGATTAPTVSYSGQYVAFVSAATNIVTGDTNGVIDVFRRGTF